jgi:3-deoxy-D-manno-octulosonic-acid transferase
MENPILENSYRKTRQEAKKFYDSIDRIWCPALNDYIIFNRLGFRQSIKILGSTDVYVTHRKEDNATFRAFTEKTLTQK